MRFAAFLVIALDDERPAGVGRLLAEKEGPEEQERGDAENDRQDDRDVGAPKLRGRTSVSVLQRIEIRRFEGCEDGNEA